jgi:hypothetical protein
VTENASNQGDNSDLKLLEALSARQQIRDAHMRYFRGVDRADAELISSAFHPGIVAEYGPKIYTTGTEFGLEFVASLLALFKATFHAAANEIVEIEGDVAYSELYSVNRHLMDRDDDEIVFTRFIRYVDRFERRDGAWKIAHRKVVCEWDQIEKLSERSDLPPYEPSYRSRKDPVYSRSDGSDSDLGGT